MKKLRITLMLVYCTMLYLSSLSGIHVEAATKASYKIQNEELTWKDGNIVRGIVSFQYPRLKGDSKAISKINKVLEDAMKVFMADERVDSIKETTLTYIDNKAFSDDVDQLYWKTTCKITYNKNNIISVHMKEMWYAGGVYNQKDYGYTFNLKTGETLTLADVVGVKPEDITNKVIAGAKKYFEIDNTESKVELWKNVFSVINNYDAKDFKYYLIPGKARICFESYELNLGTGYQVFSITAKYK